MVRAPYNHVIHLPTREETIAKYGYDKLCNALLTLEARNAEATFECQILKIHSHKWHIEKGEDNGVGWTMAWRSKKQ